MFTRGYNELLGLNGKWTILNLLRRWLFSFPMEHMEHMEHPLLREFIATVCLWSANRTDSDYFGSVFRETLMYTMRENNASSVLIPISWWNIYLNDFVFLCSINAMLQYELNLTFCTLTLYLYPVKLLTSKTCRTCLMVRENAGPTYMYIYIYLCLLHFHPSKFNL